MSGFMLRSCIPALITLLVIAGHATGQTITLFEQDFNALDPSGAENTDRFPAGSVLQPLTNSGSRTAEPGDPEIFSWWTSTRGTEGPNSGAFDTQDFIGVNAFAGPNAPDVAPGGAPVAAGSEHNFEFNDADGLITMAWSPGSMPSDFSLRRLSFDLWVNSTTYETLDSFRVVYLDSNGTEFVLSNRSAANLTTIGVPDDGSDNWRPVSIGLEPAIVDGGDFSILFQVDNSAADENIFIDNLRITGKPLQFCETSSLFALPPATSDFGSFRPIADSSFDNGQSQKLFQLVELPNPTALDALSIWGVFAEGVASTEPSDVPPHVMLEVSIHRNVDGAIGEQFAFFVQPFTTTIVDTTFDLIGDLPSPLPLVRLDALFTTPIALPPEAWIGIRDVTPDDPGVEVVFGWLESRIFNSNNFFEARAADGTLTASGPLSLVNGLSICVGGQPTNPATCPPNSLYAQPPVDAASAPGQIGYLSDNEIAVVVADNFVLDEPGLLSPGVRVWGFQATALDFEECVEVAFDVEVAIYADDVGTPGSSPLFTRTATVTPERILPAGNYPGGLALLQIDIPFQGFLQLPEEGWITVTRVAPAPTGCVFAWAVAAPGVGDGLLIDDFNGMDMTTESDDLAFCLLAPANCAADFNNDDLVNQFDVLDFVTAINANDPQADIDGTLGVDFLDVAVFLRLLETGCD
ncbi:MAG: hypothetical protein AAFX05_05685 [Planctomycetota bacterium]